MDITVQPWKKNFHTLQKILIIVQGYKSFGVIEKPGSKLVEKHARMSISPHFFILIDFLRPFYIKVIK